MKRVMTLIAISAFMLIASALAADAITSTPIVDSSSIAVVLPTTLSGWIKEILELLIAIIGLYKWYTAHKGKLTAEAIAKQVIVTADPFLPAETKSDLSDTFDTIKGAAVFVDTTLSDAGMLNASGQPTPIVPPPAQP